LHQAIVPLSLTDFLRPPRARFQGTAPIRFEGAVGAPSSRLGRVWGARIRSYAGERSTTETTVRNGRISTQALDFSAT
jgi:hypothetical protein